MNKLAENRKIWDMQERKIVKGIDCFYLRVNFGCCGGNGKMRTFDVGE
jgi:hypothetical protein